MTTWKTTLDVSELSSAHDLREFLNHLNDKGVNLIWVDVLSRQGNLRRAKLVENTLTDGTKTLDLLLSET